MFSKGAGRELLAILCIEGVEAGTQARRQPARRHKFTNSETTSASRLQFYCSYLLYLREADDAAVIAACVRSIWLVR